MKLAKVCLTLALGALAFGLFAADKLTWNDDFQKAMETAAKEKKMIFALFTGSDGCPYCIILDKEVLQKKKFIQKAGDDYIFFIADFPRKKQLDKDTALQNQKLAQQYKVAGFPTVLIMDAEGKVLANVPYQPGSGESKYLDKLDKSVKAAAKKAVK